MVSVGEPCWILPSKVFLFWPSRKLDFTALMFWNKKRNTIKLKRTWLCSLYSFICSKLYFSTKLVFVKSNFYQSKDILVKWRDYNSTENTKSPTNLNTWILVYELLVEFGVCGTGSNSTVLSMKLQQGNPHPYPLTIYSAS